MVRILDFTSPGIYTPEPQREGLREFVRFPDSEVKRENIPNSTVWVFARGGHRYQADILADDVGCGMIALEIEPVDPVEAADVTLQALSGQGVLGRGNHFVDYCTHPHDENGSQYATMMLLHTDAKGEKMAIAQSVSEAIRQQEIAREYRGELARNLAQILGLKSSPLGNWSHNTVELEGDEVIYRKGTIRVEAGKVFPLPAHLGAEILFYTPNVENMPPRDSMPHATGRAGPRGELKVSLEEAEKIRGRVYIPAAIQTTSLRSEHPRCFNSTEDIFEALGHYMVPTGSSRILSYVGKV